MFNCEIKLISKLVFCIILISCNSAIATAVLSNIAGPVSVTQNSGTTLPNTPPQNAGPLNVIPPATAGQRPNSSSQLLNINPPVTVSQPKPTSTLLNITPATSVNQNPGH